MGVKYLLDTNICIYILKNKPPQVAHKFSSLPTGDIGLSSITVSELAFGAAKVGASAYTRVLQNFMQPLTVISFDEAVAWQAGQVRRNLERQGMPIGPLDTLIAAHALALQATLVTNNTREFSRVQGLSLENWI